MSMMGSHVLAEHLGAVRCALRKFDTIFDAMLATGILDKASRDRLREASNTMKRSVGAIAGELPAIEKVEESDIEEIAEALSRAWNAGRWTLSR